MLANAGLCSSTSNSNDCVACVKDGGKWWDDFEIQEDKCKPCLDNQYHSTCTNANNCDEACTTITDGAHYRNNEGTGQKPCPSTSTNTSIANQHVTTPANEPDIYIGTTCTCNSAQYIIHTTYNGGNDYYCGKCGDGVSFPAYGHVTWNSNGTKDCNAALNSNPAHGYHTNSQGVKIEYQCPKHSTWQHSSGSGTPDAGRCGYIYPCSGGDCYNSCDQGYVQQSMHMTPHEQFFACCVPNATYNWEASDYEYDWNQDRCECHMLGAKIIRDNNGELTSCSCSSGTNVTEENINHTCVCSSPNHYYAVLNNNQSTVTGEAAQYLDHCVSCNYNSSTEYDETTNPYPRFCKCNASFYQEYAASLTYQNPVCVQCPQPTVTPKVGSVGAKSCRLTPDVTFLTHRDEDNHGMNLIPSGSNIKILPEYTDPYTTTTNTNTGSSNPGSALNPD